MPSSNRNGHEGARGNPGALVLSQGEIEAAIVELAARLEAETDAYAATCDEAADAEADWKYALYRSTLAQAADEGRSNAQVREARAALEAGEELFRLYRLTGERQRAAAAALASLRARLDAFRTLSANVRHQT